MRDNIKRKKTKRERELEDLVNFWATMATGLFCFIIIFMLPIVL